jgi:hypothetical protein
MRERSALVKVHEVPAPVPEPGLPARWRRTRTRRARAEPRASSARTAPPPAAQASSEPRRAAGRVAVLLLSALAAFAGWRWSTADDLFSERLSQGCEQIEPCRQLETEAAHRAQSCWLGCGRELSETRMARSLRYRAEERSAVREHYRQRGDAERTEQQLERDQKLADWQRDQAAQRADAEREQRQRLELERLRQDRIDQRVREERLRRVAYLALIGPEARAERLEHCHSEPAGCEALVLDLIEAAPEAAEKHKLAERNEKLAHGVSATSPAVASKPSTTTPNS